MLFGQDEAILKQFTSSYQNETKDEESSDYSETAFERLFLQAQQIDSKLV
jgi:hypothetical protein